MQLIDDRLVFAATDLSNFLACPHLSLLSRATALGGPRPPAFDDPTAEVLRRRGLEHEAEYAERLRAKGLDVVEIALPFEVSVDERWERLAATTAEAMRAGVDVVVQGVLDHDGGPGEGAWVGRPDFLEKVPVPSALGPWSYEVVDTKLAREAKGGALLQILLYADLLKHVQGKEPVEVHLDLAGPEAHKESFRVTDYAAYFRSVRRRFLEHMAAASESMPYAPDPVAHCDICDWKPRCAQERREVDHLALVAGITGNQRRALRERDVDSLAGLAELQLPLEPRPEGVSQAALQRTRDQARIQVEGRRADEPRHELLEPVVPEQGLAALPEPSDGDLFFDFEGDPFALTDGLEYLFGFVDRGPSYTAWRALDRAAEKEAFERFIDFVTTRLEAFPDLHVYHFGSYETAALKRLMGRYATREEELDRLLRGKVFVDLLRVVRQGLRASVESYSIKRLEPFYGFSRDVDLRTASNALANFEAWLQLGGDGEADDEILARIEGYNRDDCVSTLRLADWLEGLRDDLTRQTGRPVPRPEPGDPTPSDKVAEEGEEVAALVEGLTHDVPADRSDWTEEQQARWLLAQLLGFHRREDKSSWWEYYRCLELSDAEFVEDSATLGGLEYVGKVGEVARSVIHRYSFPRQEHGLRLGNKSRDPATEKSPGTVVAINIAVGTIDIKRGRSSKTPDPRALVPFDMVRDDVLRESLRRLASSVLEHGLTDANPAPAAVDVLLRRPPRVGQAPGEPLVLAGESTLEAARRLVGQLDRSVLPIQGPPGAGKTYTAARMILRALQDGKRVGVTATSHKVISNLLEEVCEAAQKAGVTVKGMQRADEDDACSAEPITTGNNDAVRDALAAGEVRLAGGTAWLWSREDMAGSVDLLFVDEAGQFSLANALAVAPAADNLVLVGDPRQLEQPQKGVHPPGAGVSALDHLLRGEATVPPNRGLFLERTWRLHPTICDFTSEIFYAGRLESRPGLERQQVHAPPPLGGSGLRLVPVQHTGNQNESAEEAEIVAALVQRLLAGKYTWFAWSEADQPDATLRLDDILVIAPYNAQVAALAQRLSEGARVGTVDKFQGQQAAIVIYSIATSTAADAPRGMSFLYSPNRLNVATSRARCLAFVVASPEIFAPECRTPEQMRLANAFCRFRELAQQVSL